MRSAHLPKTGWLLLLVLIIATVAVGQSNQGRIVGRVTDQQGAILPKAKVTITNTETGVNRILETNAAGDYIAPNLNPGLYSVTVEMASFQKTQRSGIRLEVATDLRIDFSLKPGQVSETVQVSGEQPLIDTVTETLGGTLTNKAINELPLQGRDFQNLLMLRPGVQRTPGGGYLSVTSNGNRLSDNNYMLDGTDDTDMYYGDTVVNGAGVNGTPASHLPLDAIQEFNTQQNQGADYGWKPGAVVNIGLKSGTNDVHGTAYYFHRNAALDARNYFSRPPQQPSALQLHQFGASIGGPIIKEKWFYFGTYEGTRHKVGNPWPVSSPITVPYNNSPSLSIPDAIAGCTTAGNCNDLSLKIAKLFLANPGGTIPGGDPTMINFDFNNLNREDNFVVKSDYHVNAKNTLSARYAYANSHQTEEDTSPLRPEFLSYATTRLAVTGATWTWTPNSRWVNDLRFGMNQMWQEINSQDHLLGDPAKVWGINTGITDPTLFGFPRISIGSFAYLGGNSSWPLSFTPSRTLQFSDNVSYVHGAHNLRFGGEFRGSSTDNYRAQYGKGRIDFRTLQDFMNGNVRRGNLQSGDPTREVGLKAFGGFVQDEWRATRRLSLTLGLRYDLTLPVSEAHDLLANFIPTGAVTGIVQLGKGIDSLYDTQKANFSPRAGFAWDLFGDGKTVLRAGTALMFQQPVARLFVDTGGTQLNPSGAQGVTPGNGTISVFSRSLTKSQINWTAAGPIFDTTSPAALTCDLDAPCDVLGIDPKLKTPRVLSWNVNLQRQFTNTTALQLAYVGSRGIDLYSHRDINQVDPKLDDGSEQFGRPFTYNCPVDEGGGGRGGPCFPYVRFAKYVENLGGSNYNALQVTLTQKAWRGLDFLAGYTWAHAIDNSTSDRSGYPQDAWNFNGERGNGDYDIRHRFTLSMTYDVPRFKAPLQLGKGWQFTTIYMLETGMPYNFYDYYNDISGTYTYGYERWDFFGDPSLIQVSPNSAVPWYPATRTKNADGSYTYSVNSLCTGFGKTAQQIYSTGGGCYGVPGAVMVPQSPGTFGNMGRNIFRGPGFNNWDLSLTKTWNLTDRVSLQMRGEFFNVLNHPNFSLGSVRKDLSTYYTSLGQATATPDVYVANPVVGSGGSRHIQLGLKIKW